MRKYTLYCGAGRGTLHPRYASFLTVTATTELGLPGGTILAGQGFWRCQYQDNPNSYDIENSLVAIFAIEDIDVAEGSIDPRIRKLAEAYCVRFDQVCVMVEKQSTDGRLEFYDVCPPPKG